MPENEGVKAVVKLVSDIKHRKIRNSYDIALETEAILEKLISEVKWKNAQELMQQVRHYIKQVSEAIPIEGLIAINIMKHILKVIREEFELDTEKRGEGQSLHDLLTANLSNPLDYSGPIGNLKARLLDHLAEYKTELESSPDSIATQALEHIHTNEIILTIGKSNTVEKFLKHAAKGRSFQVIVAEGAPSYQGHQMAVSLAKNNIKTSLISDAAVFAMMSRVNKVIIGTHSVMADGGLRVASGIHAVALAAKRYSVSFVVLTPMYKFTPEYYCSNEDETFNTLASPASVLPYSTGPLLNKVKIINPSFDYVPPEVVTLFISHQGGNAPSYVYRLLSELYHPDDYEV